MITKQLLRFTLLCLICLSIPVVTSAQIVFIPDSNLRALLEETLDKEPGATITAADMAWITDLDASNWNIRNLTGLEYAINLMVLWLPENDITDLRPLSGLTRLIELDLLTNSINDISPLAGLVNLTGLYLPNNYISDLSPLSGLTRLRYLNLGQNRISNILYLRGLTQLEELVLWNNSVSDISPLARLSNLRLLDLGENSISNISVLAGLINLSGLWIDNNLISDLSPLVANSGLGSGDTVDVDRNPLSHASTNSHIPTLRSRGVTVELEEILVQPNAVNIPDPNLRNTLEQVLGKARGAAITADDMARLNSLGATEENIRNLTGLEHATNLTELWLRDNFISDLSPIAGLTRLTVLDLRDNLISNISSLARLTNLMGLGLGQNSITDISPLAGLTNLTELGLGQNSITNISPLAGLTRLNLLGLSDNSISDLWPLVANSGLRNGDTVNVKGNPLSHRSLNTHIPTLQSRGVSVEFDQVVVPPQNVNIPDPNLRYAIEQAFGKAQGATITVADMQRLEAVSAISEGIRNLTGLEHATNLEELDLRDNFISDISPLAALTKLRLLDLRDNIISNISPLARLNNLVGISLAVNSISNLSPLAGLTNLTTLNLRNNAISDISPLAGLTDLTGLRLDNNSISDISPLARLTRLTELNLENNSISDISPLVTNTGLGNGDKVIVTGNPLNAEAYNTYLPILLSRGVNIEFHGTVSPTVNIPDPNLRNAIEQVLGKARSALITAADMERLIALHAISENITNLTGLEYAVNLTDLRLVDNNITDISPLARLTKLRQLWLDDNSITDISAIAGLINLSELRLMNNSISDISPLVANTGLGSADWIDLKGNFLNNVSINSHIPTLQSRGIVVEFDQIVEPVKIPDRNLRNAIEKALGKASGATITVADMATLSALHVIGENLHNLTGLEAATNLTELGLRNNAIADLSPLVGLTSLTLLDLRDNLVADLSHIAGLTNLTVLRLARNSITDISPIARLTKLKELNLRNNIISDISPLARLTNLTELNLQENAISDIAPLVANTGLGSGDRVFVTGNPLDALSLNSHIPVLQSRRVTVEFDQIVVPPQNVNIPDSNLRNAIEQALGKARGATITEVDMVTLTALSAPNKNITNLTGIETATTITYLDLRNNTISDISPLARLTNLTELYLQNNAISDLSPLVANTGLRSGDTVNVKGNPLSNQSINTHIPTLQSRGVTVQFDPIVTPPQTVNIPDANLRNAIEKALAKTRGATITPADMATLTTLSAIKQNITNLTGIEHATKLTVLDLRDNSISNLSPLAGLTNLTVIRFARNNITDISPVARLTKLTVLNFRNNAISDISPLAGLTNLTALWLNGNSISNISPLARLTNLTQLRLEGNSISDITSLVTNTGLGNGDTVNLKGNPLSNQSINTHIPALQSRGVTVEFDQIVAPPQTVNIPDSNLRNAIEKALSKARGATITLADMGTLTALSAINQNIVNLTSLEHATNLTHLDLRNNSISDLLPLVTNAGLGNGDTVNVKGNPLSNQSINTYIPTLQRRGVTVEFDDPVERVPDKITGPWLWIIAPTESGQGGANSTDVDSLATASNGNATEAQVAANGAKEGDAVGNYVWTLGKIAQTGSDNINDVINAIGIARGDVDHHSSYALITLESVTAQSNVTMRVGSDDSIKVWLNGEVVHNNPTNRGATDFQDKLHS